MYAALTSNRACSDIVSPFSAILVQKDEKSAAQNYFFSSSPSTFSDGHAGREGGG